MTSSTAAILQSGNLFVYTMHNPVKFVDPSGLAAAPAVGGLIALAIKLITGAGTATAATVPVVGPVLVAGTVVTGVGITAHNSAIGSAFNSGTQNIMQGATTALFAGAVATGFAASVISGSSSSYSDSSISASTPFTTPSIQGMAGLPEIALPNAVAQVTTNVAVSGPQLPVGDWSTTNVVMSSQQGGSGAGGLGGLAGGSSPILEARDKYGGQTVQDVLKDRKGSIKNAPLPPGGPSWELLLPMTMEAVRQAAQRGETGYKQIWKLLNDGRFYR